ncbi:MAG: MobA/MobL family protein [Legionellales bacterium]|nr:MobA/MobL family protein [Legionellales bacterium]
MMIFKEKFATMAMYHLHVKTVSRSRGQNAIASAAYRRATMMYDEQEGETYDYRKKHGVIYSALLVPDNAPDWAQRLASNGVLKQKAYPLLAPKIMNPLPQDSADQHKSSEVLWNLVERTEKRKDSQLAREVEFSLPIELNEEQSIELAREFIQDQFVSVGMIADWSVHWDIGNPHVHVLLTMRKLTEEGFGAKVTAWNKKELLQTWRKAWADYANFHLRMHGHGERIDHRSYKDQGVDLLPTIHLGKAVKDMSARGLDTERVKQSQAICQENLKRIASNPQLLTAKAEISRDHFTHEHVANALSTYVNNQDNLVTHTNHPISPEITAQILSTLAAEEQPAAKWMTPERIVTLLKKIEHHDAVFNERTLATALSAEIADAELFTQALTAIKQSNLLLPLGLGEDGREYYTTQNMFTLENEAITLADTLHQTHHHRITHRTIKNELARYEKESGKQLTDEQHNAVKHLLSKPAIRCLVGRAGTGKSFSLGAAKAVWQSQGLNVYGVALSGIAADGLERDAGIHAKTIESFNYALENNHLTLDKKSVVVMDEAGMTDSVSMLKILRAVTKANAKLVLVGDPDQLQPVGPGAIFRAMLERFGFAEIQTVYRQKVEWQRTATQQLSAGDIAKAIDAYDEHQLIELVTDEQAAIAKLVDDWKRAEAPLTERIVLAYRNEDVDKLNKAIRSARIHAQQLAPGYEAYTQHGTLLLAKNDRILFTKNNPKLGVKNGRFATITHVDITESGRVLSIEALLDGEKQQRVRFTPQECRHVTYGYAATVHKSQGTTFDESFVYLGKGGWLRQLVYVALSRHRYKTKIYGDKTHYPTVDDLKRDLSRLALKDSILNFPKAFAERRGIEITKKLENDWKETLKRHFKSLAADLAEKIEFRLRPEKYRNQIHAQLAQENKIERMYERRQDAVLVAQYFDAHCEVGKAWQALDTKMQKMGLKPQDYAAENYAILKITGEFKACEQAFRRREKLAYHIMQDKSRYEHAITIYGLDTLALEKYAIQYKNRLVMQDYTQLAHSGKMVLRDKLACQIMENIKAYYPLFQHLTWMQNLREQVPKHVKRKTLKHLSKEERQAFRTLENYTQLTHKIGQIYQMLKTSASENKPVSRQQVLDLEMLQAQRNELADHIFSRADRFETALDFYQIGKTTLHLANETLKPEHEQWATNRWYKLQIYAAQHRNRERVNHYLTAIAEKKIDERHKIAHAITTDASAHHGSILALGNNEDSKILWQQIRADAKAFERENFMVKLTAEEKNAFLMVERYVEARRSHGRAWREIFETKKVLDTEHNPSHKIHFNRAKTIAGRYTQYRDRCADNVLAHLQPALKALRYFNIDVNELNKPAYNELCRQRVINYIANVTQGNKTETSKLAYEILRDPGAHYYLLKEHQINQYELSRAAKTHLRQLLFKDLSPVEKQLLRLEKKLKYANQRVGITWQHLNRLSEKDPRLAATTQTFNVLISRRDNLAKKFIHQQSEIEFATLFNEIVREQSLDLPINVTIEKVKSQANQHQRRVEEVMQWRELFDEGQAILSDMSQSNANFNPTHSKITQWQAVQAEMKTVAKNIERALPRYQYALLDAGLSASFFTKANNAATELQKLIALTINPQPLTSQQVTLNTEQQTKITRAMRILKNSKPIENTLAERYLREHRGIIGTLPETFRYHPSTWNSQLKRTMPALVVTATSRRHKLRAIQLIYLDAETANKAKLRTKKMTLGSPSAESMAVIVNRGKNNQLIAVAEGPETALSIKEAYPELTVYCTLGVENFKRIPVYPETKQVLFCADNDGIDPSSQKTLKEAAQQLSLKGVDVWQAMPASIPGLKKTDFNDVLKVQGVEAIREQLIAAQLLKPAMNAARQEFEMAQHLNTLTEHTTPLKAEPAVDALPIQKKDTFTEIRTLINTLDTLKQNAEQNRAQILLLEKTLKTKVKWLTQNPTRYDELKANDPTLAARVAQLAKSLRVKR